MPTPDRPGGSDFANIDIVKHIANPEAYALRSSARAAAKDGRAQPTGCPHPVSAIVQFVDEEPGRVGRPTNYFQCELCHTPLWLVDPFLNEAQDG